MFATPVAQASTHPASNLLCEMPRPMPSVATEASGTVLFCITACTVRSTVCTTAKHIWYFVYMVYTKYQIY